jgi:hypothetical protein
MKIHSLNGLKKMAQNLTCVVSCDVTGAAQAMRGVSVVVESTPVTCLYDQHADTFLWIVGGRFVPEEQVGDFLEEGKPELLPVEVGVTEALTKFNAYWATRLPVLAERMQAEGREKYEALCTASERWAELFYGAEGYSRVLEMVDHQGRTGAGALPLHVLAEKCDQAEPELLAVAEQYTTEARRLGL